MTGLGWQHRAGAIEVHELSVTVAGTGQRILDAVDLSLAPGTVTGIVGESGSGKTTLMRCLLGTTAPGLVATGRVDLLDGDRSVELLAASRSSLRTVRSQRIAYLAQDPGRSLTPTMRIGRAIAERLPSTMRRDERDAAVRELLVSVGLPGDDDLMERYPFALSGGQAQRVALARALAASPEVLLLDEPTTGLDVVTQAEVLDELRRQHRRTPRTTVIVSHDLAVVARLADEIVVLRHGEIVERGPCRETLRGPSHPYTLQLVEACPDPIADGDRSDIGVPADDAEQDADAALAVSDLVATHRRPRRPPVIAADGISLELHAGRCLALVGSSGSGKSTIARAIVGAHRPDSGVVTLSGQTVAPALNDRPATDRWKVQLVPQDPTSSLNPRRKVGRAVADVVRRCREGTDAAAARVVVADLFDQVGLDPALAERRPGALSGGERQRVAIARALAASPSVLVCDEVTSALDVSVQAGVIGLLRSLVTDHGVAMLFITHDLGIVRDVADELAVLHRGDVIETGPTDTVLSAPTHSTTQQLLAASPSLSAELAGWAPVATTANR
ncbi:MAG: ABC transporter ATP-binding protein [Actinomycetota bacterium]